MGVPKRAMTASPMNLSTVPPRRTISSTRRPKQAAVTSRTSSGSRRSEREVKPTISAKRTVTGRRCSSPRMGERASVRSGGAGAGGRPGRARRLDARDMPHWTQKRLPAGVGGGGGGGGGRGRRRGGGSRRQGGRRRGRGGWGVEQEGQAMATEAPHWLQKRLPSGVEAWQLGQIMEHVPWGGLYWRDGLGVGN